MDQETIDDGVNIRVSKPLLSLTSRSKFVYYTLGISLGFELIMVLMRIVQFGYVEDYASGDFGALSTIDKMDGYIGLFAILFIISFIVCAIAVPMWTYRANDNLHRGGLGGIKYTSGWAAGWFFVPFANLVVPAKVMGEIERGTEGLTKEGTGSGWNAGTSNNAIMWWLFYILSGVISNVSGKMEETPQDLMNNLRTINFLEAISLGCALVSAYFLYNMVKNLTKKQEAIMAGEDADELLME